MTSTIKVTMDNLEEITALVFGAEEFQTMKEKAAQRTAAALETFKEEIEEIMHELDGNSDIMSIEKGDESMKVNTMINRFAAKDKATAVKFIGAVKNNNRENFKSDVVSVDMKELSQAIREGKAIIPAVIDGKIIDANFKEQQLFMLDIDDAGCSLNEIKRKLREYPYSMIYTSFSHTIAVPKYRIAFIADRVITDAQQARQITAALMQVIGCADEKCVDVSRIFFAGRNILETHNRTFSVDKLLNNTSVEYEDVAAPTLTERVAIIREEESGTDNKIITVEQIQENLQELRLEIEGTVVDYNGSFQWFNKNIHLTDILGKDINVKFRCFHPEHTDKRPSASLEEYQGQVNYRCCCENFNSPKSTIDTLHHLLDMDKIEVQYILADALGITLGSTYQREMRLLIADTKANITRLVKTDSILGKEMKHLWGALSVIQDFASAKVTTAPLSVNTNRPTFFMSQSQLKNEMLRLQMRGATAARLKLDQLKDLGFIRPLKDDEIDLKSLDKAKKVQQDMKKRESKEVNRVEYYELCAITPTMIKKAEELIKIRKQSGTKKRNMNITRRLNTYGEEFTFNVNVQGKVEQKICFNKNQKEMDKLLTAASDLIAIQGYFTEEQLRKQFDPKRKIKKDKTQKLIDDTIPAIIAQLDIKKDRVKKATREQFEISVKTKTNTVIYY